MNNHKNLRKIVQQRGKRPADAREVWIPVKNKSQAGIEYTRYKSLITKI